MGKAQSFVTNFKVDHERIENMFEAKWYSSEDRDVAAILQEINEMLISEQNQGNSAMKGKGGTVAKGTAKNKSGNVRGHATQAASGAAAEVLEATQMAPLNIFRKIDFEK